MKVSPLKQKSLNKQKSCHQSPQFLGRSKSKSNLEATRVSKNNPNKYQTES